MSELRIETGGVSDVGRRRDHNEDAWRVFRVGADAARLVCAVADGMGGHLAGEVASDRAMETVEREFGARDDDDAAMALGEILEHANTRVWQEAQDDPEKAGMGSTVVCAVIDGAVAHLANVGDSPAYLVSQGQARQITRDHSWVAEQVAAGDIRPEDAESHPYRHILTRCLGAEETVQVELYETVELRPGDALVLCSDGLTAHVTPEEIGPILSQASSPEAAAQALVDLANERGGTDNITVVVARAR